ncbi:hypothetical protein L3073_06045 [Ancylomarina sp. DW003]|nr:hypothetical protein [Ancylomarina sp. DW003]MDE5421762.1 hypothetical protein [Ancylomarina sp. DW003]
MKNIIEQIQIKEAIAKLAASKGIAVNSNTLIEQHILYCRKELSGSRGIIRLVESQDPMMDGVRNIDSGKLNSGESFICTGVIFSTANSIEALKGDSDFTKLGFARSIDEGIDTAFFNNEVSLKIQNKEKLKVVLRHAMPEKPKDDSAFNEYCGLTPFVITQNQSIQPEINCLQAVGASDKPIVFEFALVGYRLSSN